MTNCRYYEKPQIIFLLSSGVFQSEHVLPYVGGVGGPDGAGQTELCEGFDHLRGQADDKREPGPVQRTVLSERLTEGGRPKCNRRAIAASVELHHRWMTLCKKNTPAKKYFLE